MHSIIMDHRAGRRGMMFILFPLHFSPPFGCLNFFSFLFLTSL